MARPVASYPVGQHPNLPPPALESGIVFWLRSRLFSSWFSALLTFAAAAMLWFILPPIIEWAFIKAAWTGTGPEQCPPASEGACWFFITNRIHQFFFGFYPIPELWRPSLAFALLVVAAIPVLFEQAPRRTLWLMFSAAYPFIAFALLHGGGAPVPSLAALIERNWIAALLPLSFWAVVGILAILGVRRLGVPALRDQGAFGIFLLFLPLIAIGIMAAGAALPAVPTPDWGGFTLTLVVGVTGIAASFPIGILLALARQSDLPIISLLATVFIEVIRGVPMITLLFMASVMLPLFTPEGVSFDKLLRALIIVALFASAYMAETVRGGLQAIPKGQIEAASALGLGYWQTMGLIVLPQALRIVIPGIVNNFIGLFKDTTLVSIIGLVDLLGVASAAFQDQAWLGRPGGYILEGFGFVALIFFVFTYGMSQYSQWLEARLGAVIGQKRGAKV